MPIACPMLSSLHAPLSACTVSHSSCVHSSPPHVHSRCFLCTRQRSADPSGPHLRLRCPLAGPRLLVAAYGNDAGVVLVRRSLSLPGCAQESALELARILLPEMVGDISQHDLRMLMHGPATSRFLSLTHGAWITLAPTEIGLLLMGSVELRQPSAAGHILSPKPTQEPHAPSAPPSGQAHANGDSGGAEGGATANGDILKSVKDNEIFTSAISAPARLSYVSHPGMPARGWPVRRLVYSTTTCFFLSYMNWMPRYP